jgi:imidazolonepropionase
VHWRIRRPAELCYWLGGSPADGVFAGGERIA